MASIINASTSGAGGVITTADASGVLELQSAGTTRATISPSGFNLGSGAPSAETTLTPYTGFKNRIINGAMMIDQRNAGASVTASTTLANVYTLDRFFYNTVPASKFTVQQNAGSVTSPAGFINYLGATSSSAYSIGAAEYCLLGQGIEGFNIADFGWGTANASAVTLSFWVRSSLTGTFGGSISNSTGNRSYPYTYTISSANTWEQKSITITGDTAGTWLTTNGAGIVVYWSLGSGATFSGTAGAWAASFLASATGATSVVGTSGATFYITGVQLEKGSNATSFDYRPYGTELQLCQRYYWKLVSGTLEYPTIATGTMLSTTGARFNVQYRQSMRAAPSISITSGSGQNVSVAAGATGTALSAITAAYASKESALVDATIVGSTTTGYSIVAFLVDAAASIQYSAEL
jgi:hypothetical protein